jgi:hypothetical protein
LFAFDRPGRGGQDRGAAAATGHVAQVSADRRVQGVTVQAGKDPAEGPLAGHQIPAGQRVEAGTEAGQHLLRGAARPLPDRRDRVVAHDQGRARGQHQDHQQRMPAAPHGTRIRHRSQPISQSRGHPRRIGREFGLPQGQIGEVVNGRANQRG